MAGAAEGVTMCQNEYIRYATHSQITRKESQLKAAEGATALLSGSEHSLLL